MRAIDIKRQQSLRAGGQAAPGKVVSVHGRRQRAGFTLQTQIDVQPFCEPCAARGHAHQQGRLGVGCHELLHVPKQFGVQRFCVQRQATHGRLLKNCSKMMQADAASASTAPPANASVVL